jgi:hypothetical protein
MYRVIKVVVCLLLIQCCCSDEAPICSAQDDKQIDNEKVSFATDVRPLLAANCFGCHQGAIDRGGYVMTDFVSMLKGGESDDPAVVPGKPDDSRVIELITSHDGEAEMPPNADPLSPKDVDVVRRWIAAGAENDYTKATTNFTQQDPPIYSRLPVVTTIDFSPDGKWLAISGFHEVLILKSPTVEEMNESESSIAGEVVQRLIGISSRIESVKFSPDGAQLAVSGGSPG